MLVPIILGKLPGNVRQNITRDRGNDDWGTCVRYEKALRREICIQEAGQEVSSNYGVHEFTPTSAFVASAKRNANVAASDSKDLTRKPWRILYRDSRAIEVHESKERRGPEAHHKREEIVFQLSGEPQGRAMSVEKSVQKLQKTPSH